MYDLVYNRRSPEVVNIPDLTGDGLFTDADLQPFWDRINEAANPDKWIWIYNHDMNRDGIVDINDYIIEKLNYYGNPFRSLRNISLTWTKTETAALIILTLHGFRRHIINTESLTVTERLKER